MNEKCKYCDYVLKCSRFCEYNSIMCLIHRSFPKIVDKTYEELEKENKKYKEVFSDITKFINEYRKHRNAFKWNEQDYIDVIDKIDDLLKEIK